jgi:hypothetical protein
VLAGIVRELEVEPGDSGAPVTLNNGTQAAGVVSGRLLCFNQFWQRIACQPGAPTFDVYTQAATVHRRYGYRVVTAGILPQLLANRHFAPNLSSWVARAAAGGTVAPVLRASAGRARVNAARITCGSVGQCSLYQDRLGQVASNFWGVAAYFFCPASGVNCRATLALWALDGTAEARYISFTLGPGQRREVNFLTAYAQAHRQLRLEIYNDAIGIPIEVSDPGLWDY